MLRKYILPLFLILLITGLMLFWIGVQKETTVTVNKAETEGDCWTGAGIYQVPVDRDGADIRYGRELIVNTALYLGPKGTVAQITNGMNCQNCHLEAGTKPWGNNYGAVAATYPRYRDRSGSLENIEKRVNDCMERSLNGQPIDSSSREMRAIVAYIQWLGKEVPKGTRPKGTGIKDLPFITRAADPAKGAIVYTNTCQKCHGSNGQGQLQKDAKRYAYPPLWGPHSYNTGAGLYRLSRFAGFVKNNMPNPASYHTPVLTDEEAWDVAAFVNAQPRPVKDLHQDWPDIRTKPFDHPFGPYADSLSEQQHKFGPWKKVK